MNLCRPNCLNELQPMWGQACKIEPKPGGITRLLFMVCDPNYSLKDPSKGWADLANIDQAIADKKFYFSGELVGKKDKPSFTMKKIASCSPEQPVSATTVISFQDYANGGLNADCAILNEYDFWEMIRDKYAFFYLGYVTCDDMMYQIASQFTVQIGEVIEDSNIGTKYIDGSVSYLGMEITKPCYVPGLNALLASVQVPTY